MTSFFHKHVQNAKSKRDAFEIALIAEFEFKNPDDVQQEILKVAAKYQHLKLMALDVNRFTFCDFGEFKEAGSAEIG
jgi:hypothetical protein